MKIPAPLHPQRGGTLVGIIVGLLVGLGIALGVALYVSKVPVPFVDKLPQRTADQDAAETERNKNWNPNAPLSGKTPIPTPGAAASVPPAGPSDAAASGAAADAASRPATSGGMATLPSIPGATSGNKAAEARSDLTGLFIQAGAYSKPEDAEQQRAKLAMIGFSARISEREQGGRSVFRVRVGPYETREETQAPMERLMAAGIEVSLVRVERSATP